MIIIVYFIVYLKLGTFNHIVKRNTKYDIILSS